MTSRIDEPSARYLIPGIDLGSAAPVDAEGIEEDYGDAPYSQVPAGEMPLLSAWQDLLGLNQIAPGPSQIDPPPRPVSFRPWPTANSMSAQPWRLLENSVDRRSAEAPSTSPKIERMIGMLARYERAARYIRARASEGGGR